MAFKGSQRIGARDYKKEVVLLEAVDDGKAATSFSFEKDSTALERQDNGAS